MSSPKRLPLASAHAFTQRIALPSGAQGVSMESSPTDWSCTSRPPTGSPPAYVVDPRSGALLGTVEFPPGAMR